MENNYVNGILKKILIVLLFIIFAGLIGAMIGFVMGGGSALAVFSTKTWTHVFAFLQ